MKALTVWQPWASLIAAGVKPYEFRGWSAPSWVVGQRIAVHAGARKPKRGEVEQLIMICRGGRGRRAGLLDGALEILERLHVGGELWLGCVVCTAVLGEPFSAAGGLPALGIDRNDSDRSKHFNFAWPMLDVQRIEPPVPARGAQGFWQWSAA